MSTRLKTMRKNIRDNQENKDRAQELAMAAYVPLAGIKVMVKILPSKPGFAPKWSGPYEIIISGDTCACLDIRGKGAWKHWTQLKLYEEKTTSQGFSHSYRLCADEKLDAVA
ncbi:hypothetical protein scyTo_0015273 [Scyliorhinus torazame]|uniref:Murine leukemia virus integrase C-terminal domain-containing protein n=1 Tax=Scyliorhinus torazame TaxID=75743 RepID=A0A401P7D9_SCYTO|nr:hypothetical protein [Scyliorhinus torazame]